jgi:hypothetical protein
MVVNVVPPNRAAGTVSRPCLPVAEHHRPAGTGAVRVRGRAAPLAEAGRADPRVLNDHGGRTQLLAVHGVDVVGRKMLFYLGLAGMGSMLVLLGVAFAVGPKSWAQAS